jgi:serine/threonine-protein kinase
LARLPDGTRSVKVLDFGISKSMVIASADNRSLTQSSTIMGSPLYMSPEQMRAPRSVDARTDIWSLGAIIYELLSGHPPYTADTLPQLCAKMLESDPAPLRAVRPDVDPELEATVTKCLSRNVNHRWSSMGELAQALLPFASRSARVNVERAGRVLNTTENNARMAPMTLPSREPVRATPTRQSARDFDEAAPLRAQTPGNNPQQSEMMGMPERSATPQRSELGRSDPQRFDAPLPGYPIMPITDTENRASWDNSRGRQQTISAPPLSSGRAGKIVLIMGATAVLAALGAYLWTTQRGESTRSLTPVLSTAIETDPAPQHALAESPAAAVAPSPAASALKADNTDLAGEAAKPSAEPPPPPVEVAAPARPPVLEMRQRRPVPPPPSTPTSGKGLTDFGGRR